MIGKKLIDAVTGGIEGIPFIIRFKTVAHEVYPLKPNEY